MAERIFVVDQPHDYGWSNYIVAHEFEAPDGIGGDWFATGRGSRGLVDSVPLEIATAIETEDNLAFAFTRSVSDRNRVRFRERLVSAIKIAMSEKKEQL